ncbi:MAG TPA: thermonuclease family protein [Patescibacteria group bacterium]|nr:thermonuclease family protein [Patescibacteria group bacterium]
MELTKKSSLLFIIGFCLVSFGIFYLAGVKLELQNMPDVRSRILGAFVRVPPGFDRVVEAVDGDTLITNINGKDEIIRLVGVDTPETKDPRRSVQCYGHEASNFTKKIASGRPVRLERDPIDDDRDKYGRLLRYVYFEDGTTLNERLVYGGYAFAYEPFPATQLEKFKLMEADAKKNNRGLWGACQVNIKNNGQQKSTQSINE